MSKTVFLHRQTHDTRFTHSSIEQEFASAKSPAFPTTRIQELQCLLYLHRTHDRSNRWSGGDLALAFVFACQQIARDAHLLVLCLRERAFVASALTRHKDANLSVQLTDTGI